MPFLRDVRPEAERIGLLLGRDGHVTTRKWVERTAAIYQTALSQANHFASDPAYRPLFERAVREFNEWLASDAI